ncbi:MAG TPA: hypothetical protein ENK18_02245, partial [Deltaproteobacteria bacterium]|nr:hypothetical protein [Deltaproteobacteria bacterium]
MPAATRDQREAGWIGGALSSAMGSVCWGSSPWEEPCWGGAPCGAARAPPQTAGTPPQTAGTPPQTAGTPPQTAG